MPEKTYPTGHGPKPKCHDLLPTQGETRKLRKHFFPHSRLYESSGLEATDVLILGTLILEMNRHGFCLDIEERPNEIVLVLGTPRYLVVTKR
jgi:hypothetical protein